MGAIKEFMQSCIDAQTTTEMIDRLLERGWDGVPSDKLLHLSSVLEDEHLNRLSQFYCSQGCDSEYASW